MHLIAWTSGASLALSTGDEFSIGASLARAVLVTAVSHVVPHGRLTWNVEQLLVSTCVDPHVVHALQAPLLMNWLLLQVEH